MSSMGQDRLSDMALSLSHSLAIAMGTIGITGLTPVVVLVTFLVSYEVIPLNDYWLIE